MSYGNLSLANWLSRLSTGIQHISLVYSLTTFEWKPLLSMDVEAVASFSVCLSVRVFVVARQSVSHSVHACMLSVPWFGSYYFY